VGVNNGVAATVPGGKQDTALSALVLHILEVGDEVRNAPETQTDTENSRPSTN
jgi:hypothetical protein